MEAEVLLGGCYRSRTGGRAGDWVGEAFRKRNITVVPSAEPKAVIYRELLPLLNAHRCALLDHQRFVKIANKEADALLKVEQARGEP